MRKHLTVLAGVLLATGLFAQETVPAQTEIADSAEIQSVDLSAQNAQVVKTEYVINTPPEEEKHSSAGGIGFSVYSFDMSPVRRLISAQEKEELSFTDATKTLRISDYNFLSTVSKREAIPAFRARFYGINENLFHIGGMFEVAGRTWQLENKVTDTTVVMGFVAAKFGIVMEQVLVHNERNYLSLGATLGGGGTGVGFFSRKGGSAFWENRDDDDDHCYDDDDDDDESIFGKKMLGAASGFAFIDLNVSYMLKVSKSFHLRFDALCNIMGSKNGYNLTGDDYGIVNPGGSFSFIWGPKK